MDKESEAKNPNKFHRINRIVETLQIYEDTNYFSVKLSCGHKRNWVHRVILETNPFTFPHCLDCDKLEKNSRRPP